MRKVAFLSVLTIMLAVACGSQPTPTPVVEQPTATSVAAQPTVSVPSPTSEPPTAAAPIPTSTPLPPTAAPLPAGGSEPAPFPGLPLPTDRGELFSASGACAVCHTQMADRAAAMSPPTRCGARP